VDLRTGLAAVFAAAAAFTPADWGDAVAVFPAAEVVVFDVVLALVLDAEALTGPDGGCAAMASPAI